MPEEVLDKVRKILVKIEDGDPHSQALAKDAISIIDEYYLDLSHQIDLMAQSEGDHASN